MTIRLLIVDDQAVIRHGLRSMLGDVRDVYIVGECGSGSEALEFIELTPPDIVLLDIRMPGMDGLRFLQQLKDRFIEVKVIILTNYDVEQLLFEALRFGAYGYLIKTVGRDELLDALYSVHSGKRILSKELIDSMLKQFETLSNKQVMSQFSLSEIEIALLKNVAEGATNKELAELLYWSETTVKRKLSDVFEKLSVTDRAQAVAVAMRYGLI